MHQMKQTRPAIRHSLASAFLLLIDTPKKTKPIAGGKTTPRESGPSKRRRPVVGKERATGKVVVFESVTAAAEALGVAGSSVAGVCHRHNRTIKGYAFMYKHPSADDLSKYERSVAVAEARREGSVSQKTNEARAIFSLDADTKDRHNYKSIALAARTAGCTSASILQSMYYPGRRQAKGCYWYEDDQ